MVPLREKFNGRVTSCRDFFLWGHLKEKVHVNKPRTIQELKQESIRHINDIERQLRLRVVENMNNRIKVCHRSRGEYLADILCHT